MDKWLKLAMEIQSLAQNGLTYSNNVYDTERYERLRRISAEMISIHTELPVEKVQNLFCNETGYQTPKQRHMVSARRLGRCVGIRKVKYH